MYLILSSIFFPILAGVFLLIRYRTPLSGKKNADSKALTTLTGCFLIVTAGLVIASLLTAEDGFTLFYLTKTLPIYFRIDSTGTIFSLLAVIVLLCAGCLAGNLITFYLFFELLTLASMPLVLHNGSREAVMAGLKYLFYSLCGAYAALFGIYFLYRNCDSLTFTTEGALRASAITGHGGFLLVVAFVMLLGFGVKAGMFPMHAWLPTAHPVAPAPASAVLSAVIVKAGVLAIIRVLGMFGRDFLRGTWVQTAWIILTLITVFMGSLLAYREPVLKKRLAYSTVSQLSYILFGLAIMNGTSFAGALCHVLAHGFVKAVLFLCAGAIIYRTGKTRVEEMRGIGKEMPLTMWCFTIASLGLIGIPPTSGFVSKWYLAVGSLESGIPVFDVLGPVILLVSALLTAGYLLPLTIHGFFPGADYDYNMLQKKEPCKLMTVPVLILTILSILIGLFPEIVINLIRMAVTG